VASRRPATYQTNTLALPHQTWTSSVPHSSFSVSSSKRVLSPLYEAQSRCGISSTIWPQIDTTAKDDNIGTSFIFFLSSLHQARAIVSWLIWLTIHRLANPSRVLEFSAALECWSLLLHRSNSHDTMSRVCLALSCLFCFDLSSDRFPSQAPIRCLLPGCLLLSIDGNQSTIHCDLGTILRGQEDIHLCSNDSPSTPAPTPPCLRPLNGTCPCQNQGHVPSKLKVPVQTSGQAAPIKGTSEI
jgi:hypothetical protein